MAPFCHHIRCVAHQAQFPGDALVDLLSRAPGAPRRRGLRPGGVLGSSTDCSSVPLRDDRHTDGRAPRTSRDIVPSEVFVGRHESVKRAIPLLPPQLPEGERLGLEVNARIGFRVELHARDDRLRGTARIVSEPGGPPQAHALKSSLKGLAAPAPASSFQQACSRPGRRAW
jgi:hypothetical protein